MRRAGSTQLVERSSAEKKGMTGDIPASGLYWTELRILLQVARSRSFNKAAEELGVSHPTVARAVRRLETETGTALLAAGARGVVLTPAGSRLARALEPVDAHIAKAMLRIAQE
jgi:DNA-binding transcriptional LysR family regulator